MYDTLQDIYTIIPQMESIFSPGRSSRNLLGRVLGWLTGLVTQEDLDKAVKNIRDATSMNIQALEQFQKGQDALSSFISISNTRFETLQRIVDRQNKVVSVLQSEFQDSVKHIQADLRMEAAVLKRLSQFVIELQHLSEIRDALYHLKRSILTPHLIPLPQMQSVLEQIIEQVAPYHYPNLDTVDRICRYTPFIAQRNHSTVYIHMSPTLWVFHFSGHIPLFSMRFIWFRLLLMDTV